MKKLLILLMVFFAVNTFAQDIIVLKDGSTIISKVIELGLSEIKYKEFSNLQGPERVIARKNVMRIDYENGEEYSFASDRNIHGIHARLLFKIGGGVSSIVGDDAKLTNMKFSFKKGISCDIGLSEDFSIIPGLEFVVKGCQTKNSDETIDMWYIQIPVLAARKIDVSNSTKLAFKIGPYVSYGFLGSSVDSYYINIFDGNVYSHKINVFDSDEGGFTRLDLGVIAGISFEVDDWMIGFEYSHGIGKLRSNVSAYNQAFGLVFGFKL